MRKIFLIIVLLSIVLPISGCVYSREEIKYMKQLEKQASENAINYIQEKYGFSASVISTEVQKRNPAPIPDLTPDPTGKVFVNLKYNDKAFEVYISGEDSTTDGFDNYQYDKITNDILKLIETKTNIKSYSNSIYYGKILKENNKHNGLIKELYDNNIYDVIQNNYFYIRLEYINESNLEYIKTNNLLNDFDEEEIVLVNYRSLDSYNKALSENKYLFQFFSEDSLKENAVNIKNAYLINRDVNKYYKFDVNNLDDIYYYNDLENNTDINDVSLHYTTISDASNWVGAGAYENVKQISDAYLIKGNCSKLYIYVPINKIKKYDINRIDVGIECCGEFSTKKGKILGDYYVSEISLENCDKNSDIKFTLLYSTYKRKK